MTQTPNYDLNMFDSNDDMEENSRLGLNDNADKIDTALKGIQDDIDGLDASEVSYDNTVSGLTATDVQAALDEELGKIDILSTDYIVEQGTSGIWTYRKWNSGIAECWGTKKFNFEVTRQYGSVYISTSEVGAEPFPFSFTAIPTLSATLENSNGWLMFSTRTTMTNTNTFFMVRPTSANSVDGFIAFYAKGRWK